MEPSGCVRRMTSPNCSGGQAALRGDLPRHAHAGGHGLSAHAARRELGVLIPQGGGDVLGRDPELAHHVGLEPHPHGIVLRREVFGIAHAGKAFQLVDDVQQCVVAEINGVVPLIRRGQEDDLEHGGRLFEHRDAHALHFLRKLRQRELNPVVHVDGRLVRIRAHIEGHGQAHASGPRADRVHVDHVVDAVDLAFEQRSHGLSDDVGARACVGRVDFHLRRGQVGILFNGQH